MKASRNLRACARLVAFALAALVIAASSAQVVRSQGVPSPTPVSAWLTTVDQAHLLEPQPALAFAADSGTNTFTIDVDPSTTYQQMDGFGASFTDSSAWLVYNKLPAAARQQLMMQLFDRTSGIALSYLRQPIGASDFALNQYSFDDMPPGQTDPTLSHFSIDHDLAYIVPVLQQALAINPQLRVLATPWSPPGWMKSTGSMLGGSLNASAEDAYASYFVKFIQAYQAHGVPIDRITLQNEPHYTPSDYPGMWMDYPQQAEVIATHVGPALAAAGLQRTRIEIWDHNWDDVSYAPAILSDPAAAPFVAGSAWHCYAGTPTAMTTVHDQYPDREIVFTECAGHADRWTFSDGFARDMDMLVVGATRNWARTVIKWNIALDTNYGPHTGGCTTCTGLVTIDQASGAVVRFNYDYYSLGQISKFVVPGARRIASNTFGSSSVEDVAFTNPDGSTILVVFNADIVSRSFKVREAGSSFTYTLPSRAAVTFSWPGVPATVTPPAVAVTSPAAGSSFVAPAAVTLAASASSPAGISQVQFYAGSTLVGTASSNPYTLAWNNVPAGSYTITAKAAGNDGGVATSSPIGITVAAAVANPNLALGRPVVASSIENSSYAAANAVDGKTNTRWSSAFSDPQWIYIDLGSRYTLSQVVINWELAFAAAYQLQVSDDATTWTTFYSTTAGKGGTETISPGTVPTGRYLRVSCTTRTFVYGQQWGYSIWELQVYGTAAASTPQPATNVALGRPTVASSLESSSYAAANAVDGKTTTRWSSAFSDPQWIYVDLGSRFTLSQVAINWELAFAAAYQMQVSDDATTWTTFYSTSAGKGGTETVTPASPPTGRYVRVYCTTRTFVYGQQWGYSIWELRVYGTPCP